MRKPSRAAIVQGAIPLAHRMALQHQRREDDHDDLVQEQLLALHRALKRTTPRNVGSFTKCVFEKAIWRFYGRGGKRGKEGWVERHAEPLTAVRVHGGGDRQRELEEYFEALEDALGAPARRVAENLISPIDRDCCELLVKMANKRRVPISNTRVRRGLGIPRSQWQPLLERVRQFTRGWLSQGRA